VDHQVYSLFFKHLHYNKNNWFISQTPGVVISALTALLMNAPRLQIYHTFPKESLGDVSITKAAWQQNWHFTIISLKQQPQKNVSWCWNSRFCLTVAYIPTRRTSSLKQEIGSSRKTNNDALTRSRMKAHIFAARWSIKFKVRKAITTFPYHPRHAPPNSQCTFPDQRLMSPLRRTFFCGQHVIPHLFGRRPEKLQQGH